MRIFASRKKITCPLCKIKLNVREGKRDGSLEVLGKDVEGNIHMKHVGACGAHIIWDTLRNKVWEKDIDEKYL